MQSTKSAAEETTLDKFAIRQGMTNDMVVSLLFNLGILTRIPRGGRAYPTAFAVQHSILRSDSEGSYLLTEQGVEVVSALMAGKMDIDDAELVLGQKEPFVARMAAIIGEHERLYGDGYTQLIDRPGIDVELENHTNSEISDLYGVSPQAAALVRWVSYPSLIDPRLAIAS